VIFTGGGGTTGTVFGTATAPPAVASLSFSATSGSLTWPFVASNGHIYQTLQTRANNGGQAVYDFAITNVGSYVIQAVVDAPNTGANSFYVNIDAQPQDPTMIWDVPVTTGFEQRMVSWRGSGTDASNQFVPQIFHLAVGTHQLIIVGREAITQLEQLSILELPRRPQNLRFMGGL